MENQTTKMSPKIATGLQNATELLISDHKHVSELFTEFDKAPSTAEKKRIVSQICTELTVHAQIEEEIFYPAVKLALKDTELVPEARVEHESLKTLIDQVRGVEPDGEMFDAKIEVMHEYVKHHVKEEQDKMFPKASSTNLNMMELGARISERKAHLLAQ